MAFYNLLTEQGDPVIGVARCGIEGGQGAESNCVNLDIGNCSWTDVKYIEQRLRGGGDPSLNERYCHSSSRDDADRKTTAYAWYSLVRKALVFDRALESGLAGQDEDERRLLLRGTPRSFAQGASRWDEIKRTHSGSYLGSNRVHPSLFLVAETDDVEDERCTSIYRAHWNSEKALTGIARDESNSSSHLSEEDGKKSDATRPEIEFVEHVRAGEALQRLDAVTEREQQLVW